MTKDDREFVSAETSHDIGRSHVMAKPAPDRAQHEIANPMAKCVVDLLEAIDVDEQKRRTRRRLIAVRREGLLKLMLEFITIRESGQIIVVRQMQELGMPSIRHRAHE